MGTGNAVDVKAAQEHSAKKKAHRRKLSMKLDDLIKRRPSQKDVPANLMKPASPSTAGQISEHDFKHLQLMREARTLRDENEQLKLSAQRLQQENRDLVRKKEQETKAYEDQLNKLRQDLKDQEEAFLAQIRSQDSTAGSRPSASGSGSEGKTVEALQEQYALERARHQEVVNVLKENAERSQDTFMKQ